MQFYYNKIINDYIIYDKHVLFYDSPFSQWFPCEFYENGIKFTSTEQYMMYHKAILMKDDVHRDLIINEKNPAIIKQYGKRIKNFNDKIWNNHKESVVFNGNILKFTQDNFCNYFILKEEFNNKQFVEASPYDSIWGIGLHFSNPNIKDRSTWVGQNLLGNILSKVKLKIKLQGVNRCHSESF